MNTPLGKDAEETIRDIGRGEVLLTAVIQFGNKVISVTSEVPRGTIGEEIMKSIARRAMHAGLGGSVSMEKIAEESKITLHL